MRVESTASTIEGLQAQVAWLRGLLVCRSLGLPREWKLAKKEATLVGVLLTARGISTKEWLIETIWARDPPADGEKSLAILIWRTRQRLKPFGINIVMNHGGVELDPPGKTIAVRYLDADYEPAERFRTRWGS